MVPSDAPGKALGSLRLKLRRTPREPSEAEVKRSEALDAFVGSIDQLRRQNMPDSSGFRAYLEDLQQQTYPAPEAAPEGPPRIEKIELSEAHAAELARLAETIGTDPDALLRSLQDRAQLRALRDYYLGPFTIKEQLATVFNEYPESPIGLPSGSPARLAAPAADPAGMVDDAASEPAPVAQREEE